MCSVAVGLGSPEFPPNAADKLNWTIFGKVPAICTAFYPGQLQLPSDFTRRSPRVRGVVRILRDHPRGTEGTRRRRQWPGLGEQWVSEHFVQSPGLRAPLCRPPGSAVVHALVTLRQLHQGHGAALAIRAAGRADFITS